MMLDYALETLADDPHGTVVFAGGTDLMVRMRANDHTSHKILDISQVAELKGIEVCDKHISIGALATYTEIRNHAKVAQEFPMLSAAARATGALAIQNRGTLGGNIANASPAADSPPALLAYDAKLVVASRSGQRELDYKDFHKGYKQIALEKDELIVRILLPRQAGTFVDYYEKVGAREAQAISKVGLAFRARLDGSRLHDCRIAYSSVAPIPLRCFQTELVLERQTLCAQRISQALLVLLKEISPIDDIRSNAEYRKKVAGNLLKQFLLNPFTPV